MDELRMARTLPVEVPISGASYSAVELADENDRVWMMDQRLLPWQEAYREIRTVERVAEGIRQMVIRGAPAIGIAAAYGMVLAAAACRGDAGDYERVMKQAGDLLRQARPTAVNLGWAVDMVVGTLSQHADLGYEERIRVVAELARRIHEQDVAACKAMGKLGAERIRDGATVLTHCNAGALATGGYGTALGVIRAAREAGKAVHVLADETRPYWQGVRLTAWELHRDGISVEVITDGMAAHHFSQGEIDHVVVGSDRIARNGDVANKIGTYSVACLARMHDRPFFVAAPFSTVDLVCPTGRDIPIEQRESREVTVIGERDYAPIGVMARYPAFDVTPHDLVSAIFTERGVVDPVDERGVMALAGRMGGANKRASRHGSRCWRREVRTTHESRERFPS